MQNTKQQNKNSLDGFDLITNILNKYWAIYLNKLKENELLKRIELEPQTCEHKKKK